MTIKYHLYKEIQYGRFRVSIEWRKRSSCLGRFGGGWNGVVGFELGKGSLILNCLVFMLCFSWRGR